MPELPHGTITFLFTDIEGSTRLWEHDRTAMGQDVERHVALLRAASERHRGALFKIVGDATQAAFPTAPDAVAAALDGQRSLRAAYGAETGPPIRVRMALHTTIAEPRDGDYLAPGLNRLARLLGAAHGGQVLLSLATKDLAQEALPPESSLRDLGEHPLRDLDRPERIFQLLHPDLPVDFPPLRTIATRPTNLPVAPTQLMGREEQVEHVVDLLGQGDVRLLTLTGPGGVGKTRFAVQVASEVLHAFPDGTFFVDLAAIADPTLVVPTVATTLGVSAANQPVVEVLTAWLAPRTVLLVLDNLEQVLAVAPDIVALLTNCPNLTVLATSRECLHLRFEREVQIAPPALPDTNTTSLDELARAPAVTLFIERASTANPSFVLTEANAAHVAGICHRLDGLPLAIELAAAWVKVLPPAALLRRLERRLPLLTGGARDLPERQRTLRDTVAWGHDLLSPKEQILFRRLSVFSGGWSLEAAEAVAAHDGALDVLTGLGALTDKSLVRAVNPDLEVAEPRFAMLETVREFALEQLAASSEEPAVADAHASYFVGVAERFDAEFWGPGEVTWLRRLDAELPNVRAALARLIETNRGSDAMRLAGRLNMFWYIRGHFAEGKRWLAAASAESDSRDPARPRALVAMGMLAYPLGELEVAVEVLQEAERLGRDAGDASVEGWAVTLQVIAAKYGHGTDAEALFTCALDLARAWGNRPWAGCILMNLSEVAYRRGDLPQTERLARESLSVHRALGSSYGLLLALQALGYVALDRGRVTEAADVFGEALAIAIRFGDRREISGLLSMHAAVAAEAGDYERAVRLLGAAETIREAVGPSVLVHELRRSRTLAVGREAMGEGGFFEVFATERVLSLADALAETRAVAEQLAPLN